MNKTAFYILILLFTFVATDSFAQKKKKDDKKGGSGGGMSKDEIKKWKKKRDDMSGLAFKEMYEQYQQLKGENSGLKRQVESLGSKITEKEERLTSMNSEITTLRAAAEKAPEPDKDDGSLNVTKSGSDYKKGVAFKVQIGAFKTKDYSKFFENKFPNFSGETDGDGIKKYWLGYFRGCKEAYDFRRCLKMMGLKDSWVAVFNNNQRVYDKGEAEEIIRKAGCDGEAEK